MYLNIGQNVILSQEGILGIFDLDTSTGSHLTRKFLREAEKAGNIENAAEDLPKSFVVCKEKNRNVVYLSQMATATLAKRLQ